MDRSRILQIKKGIESLGRNISIPEMTEILSFIYDEDEIQKAFNESTAAITESLVSDVTTLQEINSPKWITVSKTYEDFADAATTNTVDIYTLAAKSVLHMIIAIKGEEFTGGNISAYTLDLGIAGTVDKYLNGYDLFTAPSGTNHGTYATPIMESSSGATDIIATLESIDDDLDNADTGEVTFYLLISQLT